MQSIFAAFEVLERERVPQFVPLEREYSIAEDKYK